MGERENGEKEKKKEPTLVKEPFVIQFSFTGTDQKDGVAGVGTSGIKRKKKGKARLGEKEGSSKLNSPWHKKKGSSKKGHWGGKNSQKALQTARN